MPPQQAHDLLDLGDCFFDFGTHGSSGFLLRLM
jgi:hypothetical protein